MSRQARIVSNGRINLKTCQDLLGDSFWIGQEEGTQGQRDAV